LIHGNYSPTIKLVATAHSRAQNLPVRGRKCEFTSVNDHFRTKKW